MDYRLLARLADARSDLVRAAQPRQTLRTRWRSTPIDLIARKNELMFVGDGDGAMARSVSLGSAFGQPFAFCGFAMISNRTRCQISSADASSLLRQPPYKPPSKPVNKLECHHNTLLTTFNPPN